MEQLLVTRAAGQCGILVTLVAAQATLTMLQAIGLCLSWSYAVCAKTLEVEGQDPHLPRPGFSAALGWGPRVRPCAPLPSALAGGGPVCAALLSRRRFWNLLPQQVSDTG